MSHKFLRIFYKNYRKYFINFLEMSHKFLRIFYKNYVKYAFLSLEIIQ